MVDDLCMLRLGGSPDPLGILGMTPFQWKKAAESMYCTVVRAVSMVGQAFRDGISDVHVFSSLFILIC